MNIGKLWLFLIVILNLQAIYWVNFDISMQKERYRDLCTSERYASLYTFFKKLYKDFQNKKRVTDLLRIPRITHHICLGQNRQWPAEYQHYLESWFDLLPEWQHIIWFDQEVQELLRAYPTWEKHYYAQTNLGARADVARYVILWVYGGLYVDWDQECLQPCFDELHYLSDFYIGIQPLDTHRVQLGIGIIGSIARNPLLARVLNEINEDIPYIILRTGPLYFTSMVYKYAQKYDLDFLVLPPTYFYPCEYEQRGQPPLVWMHPESLAVHHWAGSWIKQPHHALAADGGPYR